MSLDGHPCFKCCSRVFPSQPSGDTLCRQSVTTSQSDVTGERCKCATNLLAQVAGSKAKMCWRHLLSLSGAAAHCTHWGKFYECSQTQLRSFHPPHLWQAPADGMQMSVSDLDSTELIWHWGRGEKQMLLDIFHLNLTQNQVSMGSWESQITNRGVNASTLDISSYPG